MAAPIRPTSVSSYGREKWSFVATIASITAPTATEVNAAGSLDLSCYLFDSSTRPTQTTNRVTRQRRICDTVQYEQIGITQVAGGELQYVVDPQAAALSNGKKAFEKLPEGTTGFLVRRLGTDVQSDFAAGQFVDVFPIAVGPPMPMPIGDGETAEVGITQTFAVTGPCAYIKALV